MDRTNTIGTLALLALLTASCSFSNGNLPQETHIDKQIREVAKLMGSAQEKDSTFYINNNFNYRQFANRYCKRVDTIADLVIKKYSYYPMTSTYVAADYASVFVFSSTLLQKEHIWLNDYGKKLYHLKKNESCDSISQTRALIDSVYMRPLVEDLNYIWSTFEISTVRETQDILDIILGNRLENLAQFSFYKSVSKLDRKDKASDCCRIALSQYKGLLGLYIYHKMGDVYETDLRGVYKVRYLKGKNNLHIQLNYEFFECNKFFSHTPWDKILAADEKFMKGILDQ